MKIIQKITDEQKEKVVLLYLEGYSKTEIVRSTGVSWWHVNNSVHKFEELTSGRYYVTETKEKLEMAEQKLIKLAIQLHTGQIQDSKDYDVLLSCFASSDLNNHSVYLGKI